VIRIILLFTATAIAFGLIHDQVTARVCVEYFTIAHARIVASESPTVLGLVWGVVATWWAGALAGMTISLAAREGPWPKLGWRDFVRPATYMAAAMGAAARGAGLLGYLLTARGVVQIVPSYADAIVTARQARFMADVFAHLASYVVGLGAALVVAVWSVRRRRSLAGQQGGRT
jgi:hypothetical protein